VGCRIESYVKYGKERGRKMRLILAALSSFILITNLASANDSVVVEEGKNRKRTIILPVTPEEDFSTGENIKGFGRRFKLGWKGYDKREGLEIKIRLYELRDEKGRLKQRLEVKPKITGDPALRFVLRF